jgi:two-component system chemotaxis response regulator CheY
MFDSNTRILVVDDMTIMRKQIIRLCNGLGYTDIVEAADGAQALQAIQNEKPPIGLVISDYDMPNGNGLDLFRRIHNDSRFGKLPFILMALEAEQHIVVEAIKAGIKGYLLKPFSAEDLKIRLESLQKK